MQPVHQVLGPVRDQAGTAGVDECEQRLVDRRVGEQRRVDVRGRRVVACDRDGTQRTRSGRAFPTGFHRERLRARREAVEQRACSRRVAGDGDLDVEGGRLALGRGRGLPHRFEEPREQRAERELVEQHAHLLTVPGAHLELGRDGVDVAVEPQLRHLPVEEHPVARLAEVLALLRRQLVEVLVDPLEVPVGRDQLGRGLFADPGHAGEVVARIAAECCVLGVLRRRDPGALEDPGLVVEHVVGDAPAVVEHLDVRVGDQLVAVAVTGDDDHVDAVGRGAGRERRDDVVGLDARLLQRRDVQRVDDLVDQRDLRDEDVGGLLAVPLVVVVELVAERGARRVEHHGDAVGMLVAEHLHQHRREPEHRVRDGALGRGEIGGQRVEGAVGERQSVDQEERGHRPIVRRPTRRSSGFVRG